MAKRTNSQLIWRAMNLAVEYERSFIDALKGCNSPSDIEARQHAEQFIKEAREYLKKHYTTPKDPMAGAESINITELIS